MRSANYFVLILLGYQLNLFSAAIAPELIVTFNGTYYNGCIKKTPATELCDNIMTTMQNLGYPYLCFIMNCSMTVTSPNKLNGSITAYGSALQSVYNNPKDFPKTFIKVLEQTPNCQIKISSATVTKTPTNTLTVSVGVNEKFSGSQPLSCVAQSVRTASANVCKQLTDKIKSSASDLYKYLLGCFVRELSTASSKEVMYPYLFFDPYGVRQSKLYTDESQFLKRVQTALSGITTISTYQVMEVGDEIQIDETGSVYYLGKPAPYNSSLDYTLSRYYMNLSECLENEITVRLKNVLSGSAGTSLHTFYLRNNGKSQTNFDFQIAYSLERAKKLGIQGTSQQIASKFISEWSKSKAPTPSCIKEVTFVVEVAKTTTGAPKKASTTTSTTTKGVIRLWSTESAFMMIALTNCMTYLLKMF